MREVVGVLRGGPGSEYEVSLQSGHNVLQALNQEKFDPRDIFISRQGEWHLHGMPVTPERALRGVDVAVNVVHGQYGEGGQLQETLEALSVPYTGSTAAASARALDTQRMRAKAAKLGVTIPYGVVIDSQKITDLHKTALNLFRAFPHPLVVRPSIGSSALGTTTVEHFEALPFALEKAFTVSPEAVVEEFIPGKRAVVGVIDNFRNEKWYTLLPVEAVDVHHHRVPGYFTQDEKQKLADVARTIHAGMDAAHYSAANFIVSKRGVYFLDLHNAAAVGLTKESLLPKALQAVGAKLSDFLEHIINLAKKRNV